LPYHAGVVTHGALSFKFLSAQALRDGAQNRETREERHEEEEEEEAAAAQKSAP